MEKFEVIRVRGANGYEADVDLRPWVQEQLDKGMLQRIDTSKRATVKKS